MSEQFYRTMAKYYDRIFSHKDYAKEADFITIVFKKFGKNIKDILDIACGTATHALLLEKKGYHVMGCDLSEDMLKEAKKKIKKQKSKIKVFQSDMRNIKTDKKFDAAICMFTAFQHLLTKEDMSKALRSAYNVLKPNGLYILDLGNFIRISKHFEKVRGEVFYKDKKTKIFILTINDQDLEKKIHNTRWVYFIEDKGKFSFDFDETKLRIVELNEMKALLKKIGFRIMGIYGDYDLEQKFNTNVSKRMIFVCKK